jgi:hypothetical protein
MKPRRPKWLKRSAFKPTLPPTVQRAIQIAKSVKAHIVAEYGTTAGQCCPCTLNLSASLLANGIDHDVVVYRYEGEAPADMRIPNPMNRRVLDGHVWVEVDGWAVDMTSFFRGPNAPDDDDGVVHFQKHDLPNGTTERFEGGSVEALIALGVDSGEFPLENAEVMTVSA